jgi:hypothetical protein
MRQYIGPSNLTGQPIEEIHANWLCGSKRGNLSDAFIVKVV